MNKFLFLSVVIPALVFFPVLISESAYGFKVTDQEIKIQVQFVKNDLQKPDLALLFSDLDSGVIESNIVDEFEPIAVGQWSVDDVISDWNIAIDFGTGMHTLEVNPVILEINLPQGTNYPSIQDTLVDEGRNILTSQLQNYNINDYTWTLFYDGQTIIEEEQNPEQKFYNVIDWISVTDDLLTDVILGNVTNSTEG